MTVPSREEVEARLAEAKAQLEAAEAEYRRVVPCEHRRTITHVFPDEFRCGDCDAELPDPRGCRHLHIDNDTERCTSCGEKMLRPIVEVESVLSAPNAAACTNPECSGDVGDPRCENPHGIYVPDESKMRRLVVAKHYRYVCERCENDGTVFTAGREPVWDCGRSHHGDSVPVREEVTADA